MSTTATFSSGRPKGKLALTTEEHEWLLATVPQGLATKYEAAVKLRISLPTVDAWLKRPVGYKPRQGGRPRRSEATAKEIAPGSSTATGRESSEATTSIRQSNGSTASPTEGQED